MNTRRRPNPIALSLAAAALTGCAANSTPTTRPVPTGARNVTLVGPIHTIGGGSADLYSAPGGHDVYFVSPGRRMLTFTGHGYFQTHALQPGQSLTAITLNFQPNHTYEFEIVGINRILRIHNATDNRTIFFDSDTLVFFDENRTPIDAAKDPLTR